MHIDPRQKIEILITLLGRRYDAIDGIREGVYAISIWTVGIFVAAASLIIQGDLAVSWPQRVFLALAVVVALGVILFYVRDLERGFRTQFRAAVRIERLLGLYEPGAFDPDAPLYPSEWARAGTEFAGGRFFRNTYLLLGLGAGLLIAAIGASGVI